MSAERGRPPAPFRLPPETHVGSVRLQVADLPRSLDFYQQVIGLRILDRTAVEAWLSPHDGDRLLVRLQERRDARPVPRRGRFGLFHYAILLPDRAALGRAAGHLLRLRTLSGAADHRVSEALYLSDPDGLGIEVYADRPRHEWAYRDGEVQMTTEPLDLPTLVEAGGEASWSGAPAGTTIGHVHLHVGSLAGADAFYHAALGLEPTMRSYAGALFLSAGGYHHHLGTNTWSPGPAPAADEAQLLEWELVVPGADAAAAAARSLAGAGYPAVETARGWLVADPWGTRVRILPHGSIGDLER